MLQTRLFSRFITINNYKYIVTDCLLVQILRAILIYLT